MPPRVVVHADMDYFFAQCEENANPDIRGKPVVVCVYSGRTAESGVVSTCNYEARNHGVRAGIPIVRAKRLLEKTEAVFLPMNRPLYENVSDKVMQLFRSYADVFEKVSIDEAYLDVTARTKGSYKEAERIALQIKEELRNRENLTCSIGIGPNKLVAKIASDERKPGGLTVVEPARVESFLAPLPVTRIPGVGRVAEEKLSKMEIRTIHELTGITSSQLMELFGKSLGSYLHDAARGKHQEPVKEGEPTTQFSRIATLRQDTRDPGEIEPLLTELAVSVAKKLEENRMNFRSVSLIAILDDLSTHTRSITIDSPANTEKVIVDLSQRLLAQLLQSLPTATMRRIGVRVSGLSKKMGQTDMMKYIAS